MTTTAFVAVHSAQPGPEGAAVTSMPGMSSLMIPPALIPTL
ncbi:MAG: hypothetical protein ACSLE8_01270 [Rhodococcus sp. (in: high G+C Gram-positive bacteria)]